MSRAQREMFLVEYLRTHASADVWNCELLDAYSAAFPRIPWHALERWLGRDLSRLANIGRLRRFYLSTPSPYTGRHIRLAVYERQPDDCIDLTVPHHLTEPLRAVRLYVHGSGQINTSGHAVEVGAIVDMRDDKEGPVFDGQILLAPCFRR